MMYRHERMRARTWLGVCNNIVCAQFYGERPLVVGHKPGGSKVTSVDQAVSKYVVAAASAVDQKVLSEETGSSARYGQNKIFVLDPVDGTNDLIAGQARRPRVSVAAPSIGFWDNGPVVGVCSFPVLDATPITYSACEGMGAHRTIKGRSKPLKLNSEPTKGIVLVTVKQTNAAAKLVAHLRAMGYAPLPVDGAVFKACAVVDPELFKLYPFYRDLNPPPLPVVGYASRGLYLYDVTATTCIVREAGGVATVPKNQAGKQPWVAANNPQVYQDLMEAVVS